MRKKVAFNPLLITSELQAKVIAIAHLSQLEFKLAVTKFEDLLIRVILW